MAAVIATTVTLIIAAVPSTAARATVFIPPVAWITGEVSGLFLLARPKNKVFKITLQKYIGELFWQLQQINMQRFTIQ